MRALDVSNATVAYRGGQPALHQVDVRVEQGEAVAVLGANGSGKSTLVRAALGLVPLVSGEVRLFGSPLRQFRGWKQIGYVPQRLGAGSGVPATVHEVVASGRLARRGLFRPARAVDRAAVAEAIEAVGLTRHSRAVVDTLSGGQQQRVLIARALAGQPELLVLDEPTAGVDAASQRDFAAALRGFIDGGGAVALVAHELGPLEPLIHRAVVLHHGTVIHDGEVPAPAGHHALPGHDHVHPHAPSQRWAAGDTTMWAGER